MADFATSLIEGFGSPAGLIVTALVALTAAFLIVQAIRRAASAPKADVVVDTAPARSKAKPARPAALPQAA